MRVVKGNCTFEEIVGNAVYHKTKVTCPGYEDDFILTPRDLDKSFNEIIEDYRF